MVLATITVSLLPLLSLLIPFACRAAVDVSSCAAEPWGRYSMVGDFNADGTAFYSFSGDTSSASDGLGGVVRTNWKYNLTTNCWSQMPTPDVAVGYRATSVRLRDGGIVIFAGSDDRYAAVDQFWRFDEETEQLQDISAQYPDRPSARFKHTAVAILDGSTMIETGGRRGGDVLSDVWTFSFATGWDMITGDGFGGEALYRHGLAWDPDTETVWAFGGLNGTFARNGDLWRADANNLTLGFSKVNVTWEVAPPKSASLGMSYFGGKIYVWGGSCNDGSTLFVYNVATNKWCKVPVNDIYDGYSKPSRRDAFTWLPRFDYHYQGSGAFISSGRAESKLEVFVAGGDVICVYGGQRAYTLMDVWRLTIDGESFEWTLLYRPYTARNEAHAAVICSNSQRMNCRAAISIEEDLAFTGRLSGEDSMGGQCSEPISVPTDGALSTITDISGGHKKVATATVILATHLLGHILLYL